MVISCERRPFVVLSHHRCGSNFLVSLLRAHPAITCLTEPLAQHLTIFVERDLQPWAAKPPRTAATALRYPFATEHLHELQTWLGNAGPAQVRGFKETRVAEKLAWFETHVSPVLPIVLLRDPRAVAASILAHPELIDYWIPKTQLAHTGIPGRQVDADDVVARSALIWAHRYSHLADDLTGRAVLVLHLESLVKDLELNVERINAYLSIPHDERQLAARNRTLDGGGTYSTLRRPAEVLRRWRSVLSARDERTTLRIAGPVMERLGYAVQEEASDAAGLMAS